MKSKWNQNKKNTKMTNYQHVNIQKLKKYQNIKLPKKYIQIFLNIKLIKMRSKKNKK